MRVGILTFHRAANYGALLQAYALQRVISQYGHECELIDYRNPYIEQVYAPVAVRDIHDFHSFFRALWYAGIRKERRDGFLQFLSRYCCVGQAVYTDQDFAAACQKYDVVIAGSDQVWNLNLTGRDFRYFLEPVRGITRKCSYAASFPDTGWRKGELPKILIDLKEFDAISVREAGAKEKLESLLPDKDIRVTLDPTLLLTAKEWSDVIPSGSMPDTPGHYLLAYFIRQDKGNCGAALLAAKEQGLTPVLIHSNPGRADGFVDYKSAAPEQFLQLIAGADYVITDSFHGSVFSILFGKNFAYRPHPEKPEKDVRYKELAQSLGLCDREYDTVRASGWKGIPDWKEINEHLSDLREQSMEFLTGHVLCGNGDSSHCPPAGKSECCGCTACEKTCPHQAIRMEADGEGFLYPQAIPEACTSCGLCKKACPVLNRTGERDTPGIKKKYAAEHKDGNVRAASTSGGVYTALSDYVLERGGVVYGVTFNTEWETEYVRITDKKIRDLSRGAKYVQSRLGDTFTLVKKDLEDGLTVLFTGPACYVDGLKRFLKLSQRDTEGVLLTVDMVCHGAPSPLIWSEHVSFVKKIVPMPWENYSFRDKDYGWRGSHNSVISTNGKKAGNTSELNAFTSLYFQGLISRPSCHTCRYADLMRPGDLTIGDCWGIEQSHPDFDDGKGVSLVMVNTETGERLFAQICGLFHLIPLGEGECVQPQLKKPAPPSKDRNAFWELYHRRGYAACVKKYVCPGRIRSLWRNAKKYANGITAGKGEGGCGA